MNRHYHVHSTRFIPAGAGNTGFAVGLAVIIAVHPRGRGEHASTFDMAALVLGSSPRARGTPIGVADPPLWRSVHPRGRGEHVCSGCAVLLRAGSSPRARGTRDRRGAPGGRHRFIPAGAGNTYQILLALCTITVHPRGRGEHVVACPNTPARRGSSPRARGTHAGN